MYLKNTLLDIHLLYHKIIRREICLPTELKIKFHIQIFINLLSIRKAALLSCNSVQCNVHFRDTDHIISRHYTLNWLKDEGLLQTTAGHKHNFVQNLECNKFTACPNLLLPDAAQFFNFH
jgi:hypothetical protein